MFSRLRSALDYYSGRESGSPTPTNLLVPTESLVYPVTGRIGTGVHPRYSIEELQADHPRHFALFILAYRELQDVPLMSAMDIPPAVSYRELAGIHGLPYARWLGDESLGDDYKAEYDRTDPKDILPVPARFGGYCHHSSVTFPTWHRPYVMAIEQAIGDVADRLAAEFEEEFPSEAGQWVPAARTLRFPYWDWAEERVAVEGLPPVLYSPTVEILAPGGGTKQVNNPLACYEFPSIPDGFKDITNPVTGTVSYYSKWKKSMRRADGSPDGQSNIDELNRVLKERAPDIRRKVGLLFTFDEDATSELAWDEFSNRATQSLHKKDYYNSGSLEGLHDSIHDIIGGNGHMSDPDYAGFDPIFFLHHCSTDRLLALWEYVYPDLYMNDGYMREGELCYWTQAEGSFSTVYNGRLSGDSNLAPFRTGDSDFSYWTSDKARFLTEDAYPKYYTYASVAGVNVDQPATCAERISYRAALQKHYGIEPQANVMSIMYSPPTAPEGYASLPGCRHFVVVVQTPEFAFNGPYSVDIHFNDNEGECLLVGSVSIFARQDSSACQGCKTRRAASSIIRGVIPVPTSITSALNCRRNASHEESIEIFAAELKHRLHGCIVDKSGRRIVTARRGDDSSNVSIKASSQVTMVSAAVALQTGHLDGPVKWFDWQNHGEVFQTGHLASCRSHIDLDGYDISEAPSYL